MTSQANVSRNAQSSFITKAEITSTEEDKVVSLLGGLNVPGPRISSLEYFESIEDDPIRANIVFDDTGGAIDGKSVIEGLPLVNSEEVNIEFEDNNKNKIKVTLFVDNYQRLYEDGKKSRIRIEMASEEFLFANDDVKSLIDTRYDGKISDHIKKILTEKLKTKKKIDIEETANNYNLCGVNKKPYYWLNWLSKASVPSKNGKKGDTAGFFFFETSEGFKFKSIDSLFAQEKKASLIYNETPDKGGQVPAGYTGKVLQYEASEGVSYHDRSQMGADGTRLITFDPFTCYYAVISQTAEESKGGTKLAGKNLPARNNKVKKTITRTTYMLIDTGTLPTGSTQQQIENSTKQNFEAQQILNQSIRRYNQMFASACEITIAGDFSLHAGDKVFFDYQGLRPVKSDELNKQNSGEYIIAGLCHYISTSETYTQLTLIRDSVGRKGNHTKRS